MMTVKRSCRKSFELGWLAYQDAVREPSEPDEGDSA